MAQDREELLPCPFCGSHDVSVKKTRTGHQVKCPRCHASGSPAERGPDSWGPSSERAAESWNRRASPAQGDVRERVVAIVETAMLDAWNDIAADTGCHPLDVVQEGRKRLLFHTGHWSRSSGEMAADRILATLPTGTGEARPVIAHVKLPDFPLPVSAIMRLARECRSWGDECAGGSGGQTNPVSGLRYGEPYYQFADAIESLNDLVATGAHGVAPNQEPKSPEGEG